MKPLPSKRAGRPAVLGIDFGTLSARAVLIDTATGQELGSAAADYKHGVIDQSLPGSRARLKPLSALQHPGDYLPAMKKAVRAALRGAGVSKERVAGIGIDFTSCTVLPVSDEGEPLALSKRWARNPHAWVKLWKHHATQPEADAINELGARRGEAFIRAYGGRYSSEWFFSKVLETAREAPEVYRGAGKFIEGGDWIVWRLCGEPTRSLSAAGFKGMRVSPGKEGWEYPGRDFFRELHPDLERVAEEKLAGRIVPLGGRAGGLAPAMARELGLNPGIAVAAANIDAHAAVPACGVARPGSLVMIMGTSTCHMLLGEERGEVEGICGAVQDGVIPGFWGYEAGQPGVGDLFAWFVEKAMPGRVAAEARKQRITPHELLARRAAELKPGQSGLLALDWWNGNRSILADADLSGVILGLTVQSEPHEIYRALLEATAFGTRKIVEAFTTQGIPIDSVVACGGLPRKNPLLMQVYADALQRRIEVAGAEQASAFGAAMHGAVAAGLFPDIQAAVKKMAAPPARVYRPNRGHAAVYERLYAEYSRLHDALGRGAEGPLKTLRRLRNEAL